MLDRLVESKNHRKENSLLNSLLATIFTAAAIALTVAFTYSLFSFKLELGSDLEFSSLVAPIMIEEIKPELPAEVQQQSTEKVVSDVALRRENIQRPDESPVKSPEIVSVTPSTNQSRPNAPFKLGLKDFTPSTTSSTNTEREPSGTIISDGITTETSKIITKDEKTEPPVIKKTEVKVEKKRDVIVSTGVVNGKAKYLAQPVYSSAARAVNAKGRVEVQVTIDESGRVISASVISGHTLLRDSALSAARKSTFTPTLLSNERVKVTGIIVYNFNTQ